MTGLHTWFSMPPQIAGTLLLAAVQEAAQNPLATCHRVATILQPQADFALLLNHRACYWTIAAYRATQYRIGSVLRGHSVCLGFGQDVDGIYGRRWCTPEASLSRRDSTAAPGALEDVAAVRHESIRDMCCTNISADVGADSLPSSMDDIMPSNSQAQCTQRRARRQTSL